MTRVLSSTVRSDDGSYCIQTDDDSPTSICSADDVDTAMYSVGNCANRGVENRWRYYGKQSDFESMESNSLSIKSGDSGVGTTEVGENPRLSFASSSSMRGVEYTVTMRTKRLLSPSKTEGRLLLLYSKQLELNIIIITFIIITLNDRVWRALGRANVPAVKEPIGLLCSDGKRPDV